MIKGRFFVIVILFVLLGARFSVASEEDLSFVLLLVYGSDGHIVHRNDFFDVIDGEVLLVPLLPLANLLSLEIVWDRWTDSLGIIHTESKRAVQVDLSLGVYEGKPDRRPPPVVFEGDFYVPLEVLQYLTGMTFTWHKRLQKLAILGPWEASEERGQRQGQSRETRDIPIREGPAFSLGSIQYRLGAEYRIAKEVETKLTLTKDLTIHGRMGSFYGSVHTKGQFGGGENPWTYTLPFFQFVEAREERRIVLGDYKLRMGHLEEDLRGMYISYPPSSLNKVQAFTMVTGEAAPFDFVSLFVNGEHVHSLRLGEQDTYTFSPVVLLLNRQNEIRVQMESQTGEIRETTRVVMGSARIYPRMTRELQVFAGVYGKARELLWEGELLGTSLYYAVTETMSVHWEIHGQKNYPRELSPYLLGIQTGVALRLGQNLVGSFDLLSGGESSLVRHGFSSSLLYGLEKGHLEWQLSSIKEEAAARFIRPKGQFMGLFATWELNPAWSMESGVSRHKEEEDVRVHSGNLSLHYYPNRTRSTQFSVRVVDLRKETPEGEEQIAEGMLALRHRRSLPGYSSRSVFSYTKTNFFFPEETHKTERLDLDTKLSYQFLPQGVFAGELQGAYVLEDSLSFESEAQIRWTLSPMTYLTLKASGQGLYDEKGFQTHIETLGLSYRHAKPTGTRLFISTDYVQHPGSTFRFLDTSLGVLHQWDKGTKLLDLGLRYIFPLTKEYEPQFRGSLRYTTRLASALELGFLVERTFGSVFETKPDYVVAVSLSQALGFSQGNLLGQRYASDHSSYIGGVVFLDENNNGLRDEGEPLLANIPIQLDGRVTKTNEEGVFRFQDLRDGVYEVGFDSRTLPAQYSVVTPSEYVKIRTNENMFLELGLTLSGSFGGHVFLLTEGQKQPQGWIGLFIEGLERTVYSRRDGSFYLDGIPLGTYTVRVLEDTLPYGMEVCTLMPYALFITQENPDVQGVEIVLSYSF